MFERMPIRGDCDQARVAELCDMLVERGKTLGDEVRSQVDSGYIERATYDRLSRWCHPEREESDAQPLAEALSTELFGCVITRNASRSG